MSIVYEHPINERIRTLLRLEDLFDKAKLFCERTHPRDHHAALLALFEITEAAGRADVKSDLLQELERQRQVLVTYRSNPEVAHDVLDGLLRNITECAAALGQVTGKAGQHIRDNEWLATIKNRTSIPGGACEFDLPAYHHWLARPVDDRLRDLVVWTAPFVPLREAITLTLKLLRDSGRSQTGIAQNGQFQQMTTGKTFHLARLKVAGDEPVVPELSANRYALMIRFISVIDGESRPKQTDRDVPFELTLCSF